VVATRIALKSLARRILELNDEIAELDQLITTWSVSWSPNWWPRPGSAWRPPGSCWSPPATTPAAAQRGRLRDAAAPLAASSGKTNATG
jgi:transposase